MKNRIINITVIALCLIVTLVNLGFNIYNSLFYNLENLPTGEFSFSSFSQDFKTLKIYTVNCPSLGKAVRGELCYDKDGKTIIENIYWETGTDTAIVSWIDHNTVSINYNNVDINYGYDSRRHITIPNTPAINKGILK